MARHQLEKNNISVFSSNYHLYGDISMRVMDSLRSIVGEKNVEVYSVDEAFLGLDEIDPHELPGLAHRLKETVETWTGIPVSVGIAPSKTLAKIANNIAKKDKQGTGCIHLLLTDPSFHQALKKTRVDAIWGVGRSFANKLIDLGITSAWELSQMPEEWACRNLGGVVGQRLILELKGKPSISLKKELEIKKMITTTRMFGRQVTELSELKEAVATYTTLAAEKLRRQNSAASQIQVFLVSREEDHLAGYHPDNHQSTNLPAATSLTHELIRPAIRLVDQIFKSGQAYKKAGVLLSGLVPDGSIQGNFFSGPSQARDRRLMSAVDNLNYSMRSEMVKFSATGIKKDWKMRQELRSPRHTTRWEELKEVSRLFLVFRKIDEQDP
jgi:DNA polymerase V